jgi:biopolymer transport protein ExbD
VRRRRTAVPEIITRVNVTPIIDVALVLVIILLVTAPLITETGRAVNLPEARTREAENERNLCVTLTAQGGLAIDQTDVAADRLRDALSARLAEPGNSGVRVVVRADAGVPYAAVRRVLEDLRAAGARNVAIATRQKTGSS